MSSRKTNQKTTNQKTTTQANTQDQADKPDRPTSRGSDQLDYTVIRVRIEPRLREAIDEVWVHENYRDYTQHSLIAHLVRKGLRYTQRELDMFDEHGLLRDPDPTPPASSGSNENTAHG